MYIPRVLESKAKSLVRQFPILAITGPRQSGKTTLTQRVFPSWHFVSLEALDMRQFAQSDPRGFLAKYQRRIIIDEAQRVPDLFSYLQEAVDRHKRPGQFILTGSQNFLLHERISQSLAGRVAMLTLPPLSIEELTPAGIAVGEYPTRLFTGMYPRLYDRPRVSPRDWYRNYLLTYVERDVRQLKNISDLSAFQHLLALCAGRIGQLLNFSALAHDAGITHNTARAWLSILEASYLVVLLQPHHRNFRKRLVKMPKLYFFDTGLACSLLGVERAEQLETHHLKGNLFESFVMSELIKHCMNRGQAPNLFFWRDKVGHEVDGILDRAGKLTPVEIKSGKTILPEHFSDLDYWNALSGNDPRNSFMIYGGSGSQQRSHGQVLGWREAADIFAQ